MELNVETRLICEQMLYFRTTVDGSFDNVYTVECYDGKWHCDCKAFQFRGKCKHIAMADKKRCHWYEEDSEMKTKKVSKSDENPLGLACPLCDRPVSVIKIGV